MLPESFIQFIPACLFMLLGGFMPPGGYIPPDGFMPPGGFMPPADFSNLQSSSLIVLMC